MQSIVFLPVQALRCLQGPPLAQDAAIQADDALNGACFSFTAFWSDYDDFQMQGAVITQTAGIVVELNNVGKLGPKGVDFEG